MHTNKLLHVWMDERPWPGCFPKQSNSIFFVNSDCRCPCDLCSLPWLSTRPLVFCQPETVLLYAQADEPLATFMDYCTYGHMIDNVVLIVTGTLHERDVQVSSVCVKLASQEGKPDALFLDHSKPPVHSGFINEQGSPCGLLESKFTSTFDCHCRFATSKF